MGWDSIRRIFLGENPNLLWFGLGFGTLVTVAFLLLRTLLGPMYLTSSMTVVVSVIPIGIITAVVMYANGGLLTTWVALLPLMVGLTLRANPAAPVGPTVVEVLVGAPVLMPLWGTIAFAIFATVATLHARIRSDQRDSSPDPSHSERSTPLDETASPTDSGAGSRRAKSLVHRRTLLAGGGGILALVGGAGYVYGAWCDPGRADVIVDNETGRSPVTLQLSVVRHGLEVFHATRNSE